MTQRRTLRPRWVGICCFAFCLFPFAFLTANGQPAFFEPKEDYYKAKGRSLRVKWEVEPTTVQVSSNFSVSLVVTGAQNPTEIVKPDLRKLKAFDVFKVTDVADPPRDAQAKEARFAYKLAPRNTSVKEVPELKFHYFNPSAAPGAKQFPSTRAEAVEITVLEPPKVERPVVPLDAPEFLFHAVTGPDILGSGPQVPCRWAWLAAGCFGPLAAFGWLLVWRRVYPDAARLARMRRSRAARRANDLIRKASRTPDPPATIANAVLGYLRARFPLPESAATPAEIAAALKEHRVPEEIAERTSDVFRACDRARFAPSGDNELALAASAEAAVTRLEALA